MSIIQITDIDKFYDLTKGKRIMREEVIAEQLIRKFIRKNLPSVMERVNEQKNKQLQEEQELRAVIRQMLIERDIADNYPHRSTGINTLEDVLKKMITTLRGDYKRLTTDKAQRESYRAHLLNAITMSLQPAEANDMSDGGDSALLSAPTEPSEETPTPREPAFTMDDLDEDLGVDIVDDKEKMIDVEGDDKPDEFEEFRAETGDESLDRTGARAAFDTHKKIGQYILDGFEKLDNPTDAEDFKDYLVTNVKLYMDKFESELAQDLDEPTTLEYEKITGHK